MNVILKGGVFRCVVGVTSSLFICFYVSAFCSCSVKVDEAGRERQSREKRAVVS